MSKDLVNKVSSNFPLSKEINEVIDKIPSIFSRVETALQKPLKIIDEKKLQEIKERIKEQNEKIYNFSRSDSQTTRKLMTLQMLNTADSTYRLLRQILAQIEKCQSAISFNYTKLKKNYIKLLELRDQYKEEQDPLKKELIGIKIQGKLISLCNSFSYLEGAIKEIGFLQDCYYEIKSNKNIPDDWDEADFEEKEIEAHIRSAFRNGVRDFLSAGRLNMGTCEYLEQFGISPIEAIFHIKKYIEECNLKIQETIESNDYSKLPDYDNFHDFLDKMATLYKDAYKKACRRMGISDNIISKNYTLMSVRNQKKYGILNKGENNESSTN